MWLYSLVGEVLHLSLPLYSNSQRWWQRARCECAPRGVEEADEHASGIQRQRRWCLFFFFKLLSLLHSSGAEDLCGQLCYCLLIVTPTFFFFSLVLEQSVRGNEVRKISAMLFQPNVKANTCTFALDSCSLTTRDKNLWAQIYLLSWPCTKRACPLNGVHQGFSNFSLIGLWLKVRNHMQQQN